MRFGRTARAITARLGTGHILAIDRSAAAIGQARVAAAKEIGSGRMSVRCHALEDFVLEADEEPYDIVSPSESAPSMVVTPRWRAGSAARCHRTADGARLFTDGGDPLRELPIPEAWDPHDGRHQ